MADSHKIKEVIVICQHCREPFPSVIQPGDVRTYETLSIKGVNQQCPHCKQATPCNTENMSYTLA